MRVYGNWCGPGWTAGQYKDAKDLTDADREVPAIDELDAHCKTHDILLHDYPEKADEINAEFVKNVSKLGITGQLFALAVSVGGPSPSFPNSQDQTNMPRLRNKKNIDPMYKEPQENYFNSMGMYNEDKRAQALREDEKEMEVAVEMSKGFSQSYDTPAREKRSSSKISPPVTTQSAAKRFPWKQIASLSNLQQSRQDTMDMDTSPVAPMALRSSTSSSDATNNQSSGETPILYKTPSVLLQSTHTTILPATLFCSGILRDEYQALDFIFGLTDYRDILKTTINDVPPDPATGSPGVAYGVGAKFTPGFYNKKIPQFALTSTNNAGASIGTGGGNAFGKGDVPNAQRWTFNKYTFPQEFASGTTLQCQSAAIWEKLYGYYTVISCEYEIIIENTNVSFYVNSDMVAASVIDTYSKIDDLTGKYNNRTLQEQKFGNVFKWKNVKKYDLPAMNNGGKIEPRFHVIKGTYKPGQGARYVENDGDVQRWTRTNSNLYADKKMVEDMHLMFFPSAFNTLQTLHTIGLNDPVTATELQKSFTTFNMQVNLKYIVQFKDLARDWREFDVDTDSTEVLSLQEMVAIPNQRLNGNII